MYIKNFVVGYQLQLVVSHHNRVHLSTTVTQKKFIFKNL